MNYGPYPIRLIVNWGWTRFWSLGKITFLFFYFKNFKKIK